MCRAFPSRLRLGLVLGALALAGCGEGEETGTEAQQEPSVQTPQPAAPDPVAGGGTSSGAPSSPVAEPKLVFDVSGESVDPGGSVSLRWEAEDADRCEASGAWNGSRPVSGSAEIGPVTADSTFSLECTGPGGAVMTMQTVVVRAARLSWTPPTEAVDGSPLAGLAGYRVHYGFASRDYSVAIDVNDPGADAYLVDSLAPGQTYYFAVTAVDVAGRESAYSNEGVKAIP
ncbi:MAG: fibronectin type III domain-containing protein [Pseudomonadales bacterium]|nr:fibronectin type III domain-containing protein [Pseudomonadales bacterium]